MCIRDSVLRVGQPAPRRHLESPVQGHAREVQAPQERRGVDQLRERIALHAMVIDGERLLRTSELEVVQGNVPPQVRGCLLYTSDAADERSSVDLGGRRIIK